MKGRYFVTVPTTAEQGLARFVASSSLFESVARNALATYNSMRAHDGQPPLDRMPAGTVYTRAVRQVPDGVVS